jgi:tetratricopeptide (TPR) repeat protein
LTVIGALVIFSPLHEGGSTHPAQMVIRFLILWLLSIALVKGIIAGQLTVPRLAAGRLMWLFVGFASAATLFSSYTHPGRQWLLMITAYVLLFHLLVLFIDRWDHIRVVTIVVILTGIGEATWAIFQRSIWHAVRPSGTFYNPNFLAGYLTVTWALLLSCAVFGQRRLHLFSGLSIPPALRWTGIGSTLGAVLTGIVLTGSRGGMIVLFIATLIILVSRYGWKLAGCCAALLLVGAVVIPSPLRDRVLLEHQQNPVTYARWQMWQGAVRQMIDHPFGIGLGLYQYTYPQYAFPVEGEIARYGNSAQTPHNDYLQMGVEMGWGAMLVFILGIMVIGREWIQMLRGRLLGWQRGLLVGLGGGAVALLAHGTIDSNLRESAIAILLVVCGALIISAKRLMSKIPAADRVIPVHSRLVWGIGIAAVVVTVALEVARSGFAWMAFDSAMQHAAAGDTPAAITEFERAISWDSGKALYHHGLGSVRARVFQSTGSQQDFEKAQSAFREAIELNPLDNRLRGLMGQLYMSSVQAPRSSMLSIEERKARLRDASQAYEQALQLAPFSAAYRYEQGRIYWMLGERQKAEQRASEAEMLEPNYLPARALLARLWFDDGRLGEARDQLREIQSRQSRYRAQQKSSLDQAFLNVDVRSLGIAVKEQDGTG